jgi:segregation and condensation protein B
MHAQDSINVQASDEPIPADAIGLVEALLFSGGSAAAIDRLAQVSRLDEGQIVGTIAQLNQHYYRQGRPYEIRKTNAGYQMLLRPQFAGVVRRLHGRSRFVRLSVAAIEVLSIVAYRQPVNVRTIDADRGVESGAIVRQLRRRNLIEVVTPPPADGDGSDYFKTTRRFLQVFQLQSLDDLPRVQELEKA